MTSVSLKRPYFPRILNQMLMCKLFPHQTWVLFYTNLPRACYSSMVSITIIMKPKHLLMTSYCSLAGVTVFNQSWNKTTKHSSGPLCAPALFLGNVKHQRTMFWRFCTKNNWYETNTLWCWSQSKERRSKEIWHLFVQAKILFQVLTGIVKEEECAQACGDSNPCSNYTYFGPGNPLRWVNK